MEPYVTRNSDYSFLVNQGEMEAVRIASIEDQLLWEGGDPVKGMKGILTFNPKSETRVALKYHPEGTLSWDDFTAIELIINKEGWQDLYYNSSHADWVFNHIYLRVEGVFDAQQKEEK